MAEEVLGTDMKVDLAELDLKYGVNNDVAKISGYDNLHQAISLRFITQKGSMPLTPTYGSDLPTLKGASQTEETLSQAILYATEALNQDPRVDSIEDVDANFTEIDGTTYIEVSSIVIPIENDLPLNVVVVIS